VTIVWQKKLSGNGDVICECTDDVAYQIVGEQPTCQDPNLDMIKTEPKETKKEKSFLVTLRSFFLVLAMSIHSVFEGMAIGLDESEAGVWKLGLAISIHAIPIVFCIGTEMIASGVKKGRIIVFISILSIVTPIGVVIGIIITLHLEQASGGHIFVIGVLQGLAGGTLLYIAFFEVLAREKLSNYGMSGLLGAFAVLLGFLMMAGMEAGNIGHQCTHSNTIPNQAVALPSLMINNNNAEDQLFEEKMNNLTKEMMALTRQHVVHDHQPNEVKEGDDTNDQEKIMPSYRKTKRSVLRMITHG